MGNEGRLSVAEVLLRSAGAPTDTALAWDSHRRTYEELRQRSTGLAGAMLRGGLQPGDRVAVHLLSRGETFELYFACALAGLTLVPVNFRLTVRELEFVVEDSGAKMIFTQESIAETARAAASGVPTIVLGDEASGEAYEAMVESAPWPVAPPTSETHLLLFTSGTTGRPKGVRLTHMNIMWFAWQQLAYYGLDRSTVALLAAPTFNMAGISLFSIPTFLVGGTVVVQPSHGWRPDLLVGLVRRWGITHTNIFPSQFKTILAADEASAIAFESLRLVATGGESCPPELLRRFRERWPHIRLLQGYGQTETGVVTVSVGDDLARHPSSIGRSVVGTSCRVLGPDGLEAPVGETGELYVNGPSVTPGYWNAPELTDASFVDGWFATGDLGHRDDEGLLYISGRSKDVIISKAQNIYPAEIEHVLLSHDQIAAVAVVGIPDDEWGEVVTAAVVRTPGSTLSGDEVVAFSREALASYKKPRHVVFVEELPRNGASKVIKDEVKRQVIQSLRD